MDTADDVWGMAKALVGDPDEDFMDPDYFLPFVNIGYRNAIQYLKGTCSPYIEDVVIVPGVPLGPDPSDLLPFNTETGGATAVYPLKRLVTPKFIDFKLPNTPANQFRPAKECRILSDTVQQVTPQTFDIRVRGDFLPPPLSSMDSVIQLYPNCAHALAFSTVVAIGAEKPNAAWVEQYAPMADAAWDLIANDMIRQQQRLSFRLGSPNRQGQRGFAFNLQGCVGWEFRSNKLLVKLI